MIEEDPQPFEGDPEPEYELEPDVEDVEPRAKSPWKAFILTGFLAGLIGAAGGGYGAYAALKKFAPAPIPQAAIDLTPIETRLTQLTQRVADSEAAAEAAANSPMVEPEPVETSGAFLDLESRFIAIEKAPRPEIDPAALSALQAAQKDGFEWPDTTALEDRIAGLETKAETSLKPAPDMTAFEDRLAALEAQAQTRSDTDTDTDAAVPSDLMDRINALEDNVQAFQNAEPATGLDEATMAAMAARVTKLENRPPPMPTVETVAILAFPKAQMIAAVEENMEGGMIKKTLSRHIRVKDDNDPLTLIDGIEADLSGGRLGAAAEKFERLPAPVRAKGQAWYESVKASL